MMGLVYIIVFFISLETILQIGINKKFTLGKWGQREKNVSKESQEYANRSLNIAAIVFTGVALLIGILHTDLLLYEESLSVFILSFFLFLISYKLEIFIDRKRIVWFLQQRVFNFGFLSLIIGMYYFILLVYSSIHLLFLLLTIVMILFHFFEYLRDMKNTRNNV